MKSRLRPPAAQGGGGAAGVRERSQRGGFAVWALLATRPQLVGQAAEGQLFGLGPRLFLRPAPKKKTFLLFFLFFFIIFFRALKAYSLRLPASR